MVYKLVLGGLIAITAISLWVNYNYSLSTDSLTLSESVVAFQNFRKTHNKSYSTMVEASYRFKVFSDNLEYIKTHNAKNESCTLAINQFADMTFSEFKANYLSVTKDIPDSKCDKQPENLNMKINPDKIDWESQGKVQQVKDQGHCGSCWAFSAVGSIESAYAIFKNVDVPNLSEQELVDCSKPQGNLGCNGGLMNLAFDYVMDFKLNTQSDYPYKAWTQTCKDDKKGHGNYGIKKCVKVEPTIDGLTNILVQQPVSVAIAVGLSFMFYDSGVLDPYFCEDEVNHGVLAVGYDLTAPKPFFKVKNSWGTSWGEKGYFRVAIGKNPKGVCNIAGSGKNYYPVV